MKGRKMTRQLISIIFFTLAFVLSSCSESNVTLFGERLKPSDVASVAVYIDDSNDNSFLKNNDLFKITMTQEVCKALRAKKIPATPVFQKDIEKGNSFSHAVYLRSDGIAEKQGLSNGRSYAYNEIYVTAALFRASTDNAEIVCQASVCGDGMDMFGNYFNTTRTGQILGSQPDLKDIYLQTFITASTALFSK